MDILNEEKGIATTALPFKEGPEGTVVPVAKAINIVLNTRGSVTGLDDQGNVHIKNANGNNYILAQGGRTTMRWQGPLPQIILAGQDFIDKVNSYKVDDIAKEKVEQYCKEQKLKLVDSGEFQINGMITAMDANGTTYYLKATSDPDDPKEYIVEPFNDKGELLEKKPEEVVRIENNRRAATEAYSNSLTTKDIMLMGQELSKYFRKFFKKWIETSAYIPFKDVSVQVTSGTKKEESLILKYKRLLEADDKTTVATLRVMFTFIPDPSKFNNKTSWDAEALENTLKVICDQFVKDHTKGVTFRDGEEKFLVNFANANHVECKDEKGFVGYFDLYATKIYKSQGKFLQAAGEITKVLSPVKDAGKGLGHN